jgi:chemotaxis protein MotB
LFCGIIFSALFSKKQPMKNIVLVICAAVLFTSCVSPKLLRQSQAEIAALRADSIRLTTTVSNLESTIANLRADVARLNKEVGNLSSQNNQLGAQTAEQRNQLSQSQAELQRQQERLQQLQALLNQQREQSDQLRIKMAEALKGFASSDLSVYQKSGKVYVRLSENLLFPSGSAVVNPKGVDALSKLAAVLNLNSDVAVNIEGHTDSIPIRGKFSDNWELSTARANAIVRVLVNNYRVDPLRVIASGHSYYDPIDTNATPEGRARNRRTEIILSPKLDELYRILER